MWHYIAEEAVYVPEGKDQPLLVCTAQLTVQYIVQCKVCCTLHYSLYYIEYSVLQHFTRGRKKSGPNELG